MRLERENDDLRGRLDEQDFDFESLMFICNRAQFLGNKVYWVFTGAISPAPAGQPPGKTHKKWIIEYGLSAGTRIFILQFSGRYAVASLAPSHFNSWLHYRHPPNPTHPLWGFSLLSISTLNATDLSFWRSGESKYLFVHQGDNFVVKYGSPQENKKLML